jgi:hypothetical protein
MGRHRLRSELVMMKLEKRQIIILGVMGIVIVFGVFSMLTQNKKPSVPAMSRQTAELNAFVTNLVAGLPKDTTKNLNAVIFNRAEKEWQQDPFLDAKSYRSWTKSREPAKAVAAAPKSQFAYTGYVEANNEKMAIINGMEYREGENLDVNGFRLKSVSPVGVVIENRSTKAAQRIPIQE